MIKIIFVLTLLFLAGCMHHDMDSMPCHQMPDGSWMGQCDEMSEGDEHSHHSVAYDPKEVDVATLDEAKPTSIVDLKDGDEYTIRSSMVKKTFGDVEVVMYAYNEMIPGVALRVEKDSTVTIHFENNIDMQTTIHWHGLRHDIKNDGVPGISQDPVEPGQSHTYTLYFPDAGIFWYHPHVREDVQQGKGLTGNMLVKPTTENYYSPVNSEELLVLDDILLDEQGIVPFGEEYANHALMGRFGNTLLVNGQDDYTINVHKGEVVRFYITNIANVRPFNLLFENAQMKLIGSDLSKYEKEVFIDSQIISPAERYIVEVYFDTSGIHNIIHKTPQKEYVIGQVRVAQSAAREDFSKEFLALRENTETIKDIQSFSEHFDKDFDYQIDLSVQWDLVEQMKNAPCHQMGGVWMGQCDGTEHQDHHEVHTIEWEDEMGHFNTQSTSEEVRWILRDKASQKENMDMKLQAKVGDVIKIRLFNDPDSDHPMQHPFHLHGQRFLVTHRDEVAQENLVWKDTVLVTAGETVDILVDVTNPGEWMMHCHIAEHLESGMMSTFVVTQ